MNDQSASEDYYHDSEFWAWVRNDPGERVVEFVVVFRRRQDVKGAEVVATLPDGRELGCTLTGAHEQIVGGPDLARALRHGHGEYRV